MRLRHILALAAAAILVPLAAPAAETAPAYTFKWSGYIKADFAYDETRVNSGNYALYVLEPKPAGASKNDVLSATARETRLGFEFNWLEGDYRTDAKVELDFYGLGVSSANLTAQENKAAPMLRHAYVQVARGRWSILAGQTSDVMSPLVPKTVNYTVCWDQGNIGYRRPQLRLSTFANPSERAKFSLAVAAARTIGGDLDADGVDDGADSAAPTIEGRLGAVLKPCSRRSFDVGVSGHYGKETWAAEAEEIESWSANADLRAMLSAKLELSGEYFVGRNLGGYLGGVGQTVNPLGEGIGAKGGWAQISFAPVGGWWINAGYSVDDPDEEDLNIAAGGAQKAFIDRNENIFGSVFYNLTSNVQAMLEVSRMTTAYLYKVYDDGTLLEDSKEFDSWRVQFALKAAIK
jgi:hypothetical protein